VRPEAGEAWEYDLALRATEQAGRIDHITGVLLHRGPTAVDGDAGATGVGADAGRRVLEETMTRRGEEGHVEAGPRPGTFSVRRRVAGDPLVSIIVPFRDGAPLLRRCVDSVLRTVDGVRTELVLVDNASTEPESLALVRQLSDTAGVRVVEDARPFNWAAINNRAVAETSGTVLLFLNDDVAARHAGWLAAMLEHAVRPDVGAVGARLVYPTGQLQHAGVVIGLGGAAGHVLRGLPGDAPGYLDQAVVTRDVSAVTGACLMTRRSCFEEMGGFDEDLSTDLNDVDYCLRLRVAGYRTVVTPLAELVHEESPTRGSSGNVTSIRAFLGRWEPSVRAGDPYLNRNLTRLDGSCRLRTDDEEGWWESWRASLVAETTA
jgi:GT2 family glycosyltransferase